MEAADEAVCRGGYGVVVVLEAVALGGSYEVLTFDLNVLGNNLLLPTDQLLLRGDVERRSSRNHVSHLGAETPWTMLQNTPTGAQHKRAGTHLEERQWKNSNKS